jgi:hypothetical protein
MCPYFAMFPEGFVQTQLLAFSRPGDWVFDPFCGRGTTVLESLLNGRIGIGVDINPVAACVSGAKANIPRREEIIKRLNELSSLYEPQRQIVEDQSEFFRWCFSQETLKQILYLRSMLLWRDNPCDRFIAAVLLGVLHGESHRTELCLSNRMPRTISTKPEYSVRWWKSHDCHPPERNAFEVLRKAIAIRLAYGAPELQGYVELADARCAARALYKHKGRAILVITSPPYLDTTDYAEDQWLRLWLLGGSNRPVLRLNRDDRHTDRSKYWKFLADSWSGCNELISEQANFVIRIGGASMDKRELLLGLQNSLQKGLHGRKIKLMYSGMTSTIKRRQTNAFRPGTSSDKFEHDFVFSVR